MVDRELVVRKMALILEDLRAVTPIAEKPLDAYLASQLDEVVHEGLLAAVRDIPEYLQHVHTYVEATA